MTDFYKIEATLNDGQKVELGKWRDKSLLIVNTASKCGFTNQYEGLEKIYKEYKSKGLEILAFPCNQFGNQEPGSDEEIAQFCQLNYATSFPLFKKVDVNGNNAHPLFIYLCEMLPGIMGSKAIKWNFTKFFVDKHGNPVKRFAPQDTPEQVMEKISAYL